MLSTEGQYNEVSKFFEGKDTEVRDRLSGTISGRKLTKSTLSRTIPGLPNHST